MAITGGARGIGLATAKAFAAHGSRVFIGDLDADLAAAAATGIGGHGMALDVRSRQSFAAFLDAVGRCAADGVGSTTQASCRSADLSTRTTRSPMAILDINARGVLIGTKLALPGMLARGTGHIVNVSSYLGKVPAAGLATYCASKYAVVGFSGALRDELAGTGVTVSVVLPCAVRTELTAGVKLGGVLPTVDPIDIANAVVRSCARRRAVVAVPGWMRIY